MLSGPKRCDGDLGVQIMGNADVHAVNVTAGNQLAPGGVPLRMLLFCRFFELLFIDIAHCAQGHMRQFAQCMKVIA